VTPESRALVVETPFGHMVWNRPTAILAEDAGEIRRLAVVDVTRVALLSFLTLTALGIVAWLRCR